MESSSPRADDSPRVMVQKVEILRARVAQLEAELLQLRTEQRLLLSTTTVGIQTPPAVSRRSAMADVCTQADVVPPLVTICPQDAATMMSTASLPGSPADAGPDPALVDAVGRVVEVQLRAVLGQVPRRRSGSPLSRERGTQTGPRSVSPRIEETS